MAKAHNLPLALSMLEEDNTGYGIRNESPQSFILEEAKEITSAVDMLDEDSNSDDSGDESSQRFKDELADIDSSVSSLDNDGAYKSVTASYLQDNLAELYKQRILTDLDVKVDNKVFYCHKVVLSAVSGYFRSMLESGMQESSNNVVPVNFIRQGCFKSILDFIYMGSDIFTSDNIDDILEAAVLLQMRNLEETCVKFISASLNIKNCLDIWNLCQKHNCRDIARKAWNLATTKFGDVMEATDLINVREEVLMKLLTDRNLLFKTEDVLCQSIMSWVDADPDIRSVSLPKLFNFLCLPEISGDFLFNRLYKNEIVNQYPVIRELVDDAVKCHLIPKEKDSVMMKQNIIRDQKKYRKVLMVIGGNITDSDILRNVSCWDEVSTSWYSLESIPHQVGEDFSTCVVDNKVYISGGSRTLNAVACYDPSNNSWSSLTPLKFGRELHSMVSIGNCLYVQGGRDFKRKSDSKLVSEIEMLEIGSKCWNVVGKLLQPLEDFATGVIGSRIFLYGGMDELGLSKNISFFDVNTKECSIIAVMEQPYRRLRSVYLEPERIHLISTSGNILVHNGDDTLDLICTLPNFNIDKFALTSDGVSVTIAGGISDDNRLDEIYQIHLHDQILNKWAVLGIPIDGLAVHFIVMPTMFLAQKGMSIGDQEHFPSGEISSRPIHDIKFREEVRAGGKVRELRLKLN